MKDIYDVFMSILPRSSGIIAKSSFGIPLRVVMSDGVTVNPDIKFTESTLDNGMKVFHNNSTNNPSFNITILIHKEDMCENVDIKGSIHNLVFPEWYIYDFELEEFNQFTVDGNKIPVYKLLDYCMKYGVPFYVNTKAVGIGEEGEPALWLITKNGSRKQSLDDGYMLWDLTFSKYTEWPKIYYNSNSTSVQAALDAYNKKKETAKKSTAKNKTTDKEWLAKCDYKKIVYTKKKPSSPVKCVRVMQRILFNHGHYFGKDAKKANVVDGWYGDTTKAAVKAYQKAHHNDYNLPVTGNVGYYTWMALCGKGKQAATVKAAKSTVSNMLGLSTSSKAKSTVSKVSSTLSTTLKKTSTAGKKKTTSTNKTKAKKGSTSNKTTSKKKKKK